MFTRLQPQAIQSFAKLFNIRGFIPTYDSATELTTSSGICVTGDSSTIIDTDDTFTKNISSTWVEGSNGGLASAVALSAGLTLHKFLIQKPNGTLDVGYDTDLSATNLLADASSYTQYRRLSSYKLDGSSNFINFTAYEKAGGGVEVRYVDYIEDLRTQQYNTKQIFDVSAPSGTYVIGYGGIDTNGATGTTNFRIKFFDKNITSDATTFENCDSRFDRNSTFHTNSFPRLEIYVRDGQIAHLENMNYNGAEKTIFRTIGYIDERL